MTHAQETCSGNLHLTECGSTWCKFLVQTYQSNSTCICASFW